MRQRSLFANNEDENLPNSLLVMGKKSETKLQI